MKNLFLVCSVICLVKPAVLQECVGNNREGKEQYRGKCTSPAACIFLPTTKEELDLIATCSKADSRETGFICCPNESTGKGYFNDSTIKEMQSLTQQSLLQKSTVTFTVDEVNAAFNKADEMKAQNNRQSEKETLTVTPSEQAPQKAIHEFLQFLTPQSLNDSQQAFQNIQTATQLAPKFGLEENVAGVLHTIRIKDTRVFQNCPPNPVCQSSKYRTINGQCNNLAGNPNWGKSERAFNRFLLPKYADGVSTPRVSSDGSTPLPSARLVSSTVIPSINNENPYVTILHMSYGQFLDHDLTQTPIARGPVRGGYSGSSITCCNQGQITGSIRRNSECFPIDIPADDPFFSDFDQTCMEFVRSSPAALGTCNLSWREQQNQLTAYIDGSQIYGSVAALASQLRLNAVDGKLRVNPGGNHEFPPNQDNDVCTGNTPIGHFCFLAGDTRANEQPQLSTLQVLFLREHNRIATELKKVQPSWTNEVLFQESRRIVGAIMQRITVNEYLRIVLGPAVMTQFQLLPSDFQISGYNKNKDATIFNEFAAAAFRFGHSMVNGTIKLGSGETQDLRDMFLLPFDANLMDSYITGCTFQKSQKVENYVTEDLTNHLFQNNQPFGLDLPALNMQRGRDHGIQSYIEYRRKCSLWVPKTWKSLNSILAPGVADKLESVYAKVEDIDLWIGAVSEKPIPQALVGETLACLIGTQFQNLKFGDRYWFEWAAGPDIFPFTPAQFAEIKKSSLARLICDNSGVKEIQPLPFYIETDWNKKTLCSNIGVIPKMSFTAWKV